MKKIYILIFILMFTTGCACRYDLIIDGDSYKESIILRASTASEQNDLNKKWEIPVDKDNYYSGDENIDKTYVNYIYDYSVKNDNLVFSHNFGREDYLNSTAVSLCYNSLSVSPYQGNIVISTGGKVTCFDKYPNLSSISVNITVDKEVISNNADKVDGNTYTWNLTKSNADNKSINLVFKEKEVDNTPETEYKRNNGSGKYTMYILAGILLIVVLVIYFIFNNLKGNNDEMDD